MKTVKFKNKKEVDAYFAGKWIECLLCGKKLKAVGGQHLKTHGVTCSEYQKMFGLPATRGLVCEETAERERMALEVRRLKGDRRLMLTDENRKKAWSAQHKKPPPYHYVQMKRYAKKGRSMIDVKVQERLRRIDWEGLLSILSEKECAFYALDGMEGVPTYWELTQYLDKNPDYGERYKKIIKSSFLKEKYRAEIIEHHKNGYGKRKIAKIIPVSPSHIQRVIQEEALKENRS